MRLLKLFSFEQLLKIGFGFSVLLLLSISVFSFYFNQSLINNAQWVDHTNEVIQKLTNINLIVKDVRITQRNFMFSKDEKTLAAFYGSKEKVIAEIENIKILTRDNPTQQANADTLRSNADEYFDAINLGIEETRAGKEIFKIRQIDMEISKINGIISAMQLGESNLLKMRLRNFNTSSANTPALIIFFSFIALGIVTVSYLVISENLKRIKKSEIHSQEAYQEVQAVNEELSATNEELRASNEELHENREKLRISFDELNQNKQKLVISEERLIEAQSIAQLGNWEWDIKNNSIYWSEELKKIFDFDPGTIKNFDFETYLELLHPDDRILIEGEISKALKDFLPYTFEHRIFKKDGSIRWVLAKGKPILSEGKLIKLIGAILDITDLRSAKTEQLKLAALVDNCFDFIAMADMEGRIEFINEAGLKMIGLTSPNEARNKPLTGYFAPEHESIKGRLLSEIVKNGRWEGNLSLRNTKTNQLVPVTWNAFIVKDSFTGNPVGIACISQNIEEIIKKQVEIQLVNNELSAALEELKQAEENLISSNKALESRVLERTKDLAESEERFRLVSQATNDAIWDWDIITDKIWWNEGFKATFGFNDDQIGQGLELWNNKIHPDDKNEILKSMELAFAKKELQWTAEYKFMNAKGIYMDVFDRGTVLYNEDGKPYRMVGSMINISERKKIEEERELLRKQADKERAKLYNILVQAPAAITLLKGPNLIHEMANQLYYELTGVKDLIGKPAKLAAPLLEEQGLWDVLTQVYNSKTSFVGKEFAIIKNQQTNYFNLVAEPVLDKNKNTEAIMIHAVDVTEQIMARKQMEESAERLTLLLEAIPQMAWTSNPQGEASFFNKRWYEFTGSDFETLKGWGWNRFLHPDDVESTYQIWNNALTTGEIYELEYRWKRASDNSYRWMLGRAVPIKNSKDEIILWVGTCTDIHDQKTTEADLNLKNMELLKINELLDTFVYAAAHDLKGPVINLKGLFQLIQETEDGAAKDEYFSTVNLSVKRLEDTISGLVDVIDIQSEDKVSKKIDLRETLATMIKEFEPQLQHINGKIEYNVEACSEILYLKSYINSIFTNLISNSIKYRDNKRNLLIKITSMPAGEYTLLTVEDNGTGIDLNKFRNKLFKAFHRFSRISDGKGIGLYLIKTIVERNGGKIDIESHLNKGTTFKIFLKEYS